MTLFCKNPLNAVICFPSKGITEVSLGSQAGCVCVSAEMAAAEMQLLRQALDKLQSETHVLDDELARSREQAIFSEFERAELSHDLELVVAQLRSCEASKAELEATIAKVLFPPPPLPAFSMPPTLCCRVCGRAFSSSRMSFESRSTPRAAAASLHCA